MESKTDGSGVGLCARASSVFSGTLSLLGLCLVLPIARPASLPSSSGHVVFMLHLSLVAH